MSLLGAVRQNNREEVERLLRSGSDVNEKDGGGSTALMWAAMHGHTEIADLLVRSNADVNVKDNVRLNTIYIIYIP